MIASPLGEAHLQQGRSEAFNISNAAVNGHSIYALCSSIHLHGISEVMLQLCDIENNSVYRGSTV